MKILSLNALDGELRDELKDFLGSQLSTTDVFCFQETLGEAIETLLEELFPPSHYSTTWIEKVANSQGQYNLCTVIKKPLVALRSQTLFGLTDADTGQALASTITLPDNTTFTVVNVHGAPFPGHKLDTEGRLRQSDTIIEWLKESDRSPAIVCGDFNLLPETESIQKFALADYKDLIADYNIPTTRNELAWKHWPDNKQLFADYSFTSPELKITEFTVPDIEVSDHLPMLITIDF